MEPPPLDLKPGSFSEQLASGQLSLSADVGGLRLELELLGAEPAEGDALAVNWRVTVSSAGRALKHSARTVIGPRERAHLELPAFAPSALSARFEQRLEHARLPSEAELAEHEDALEQAMFEVIDLLREPWVRMLPEPAAGTAAWSLRQELTPHLRGMIADARDTAARAHLEAVSVEMNGEGGLWMTARTILWDDGGAVSDVLEQALNAGELCAPRWYAPAPALDEQPARGALQSWRLLLSAHVGRLHGAPRIFPCDAIPWLPLRGLVTGRFSEAPERVPTPSPQAVHALQDLLSPDERVAVKVARFRLTLREREGTVGLLAQRDRTSPGLAVWSHGPATYAADGNIAAADALLRWLRDALDGGDDDPSSTLRGVTAPLSEHLEALRASLTPLEDWESERHHLRRADLVVPLAELQRYYGLLHQIFPGFRGWLERD